MHSQLIQSIAMGCSLSSQVEQSDSSYMPSVVAVLAGNTIGSLKEIKQVSVPSTCRECVLLSGITEVWLSTVTV